MLPKAILFDLDAPQRFGIYSIWNDWNSKGLPENSSVVPDRIIHNISELLNVKEEL